MNGTSTLCYKCNQGSAVSFSLFSLAYCILNLGDKLVITLFPVHILKQLNVKADYPSWVPEWHLLPDIAKGAIYLWGQLEEHVTGQFGF